MRRPSLQQDRVTLPGRLALLVVLAAGFLTMHGFFAVSAGADAHVTTPVAAQNAHAADHPASKDAAPVVTGSQSPSPHPADYHDLLAGCVVALVGVAVVTLAHLFTRRGPFVAGRSPATVPRVLSWGGDHAPALPPPRIALCVIRV